MFRVCKDLSESCVVEREEEEGEEEEEEEEEEGALHYTSFEYASNKQLTTNN